MKGLFSFIFVFFIYLPLCQAQSACDQAYDLVKTVKEYHYDPRPLNAEFSETVFNKFLDLLDSRGMIFSREDIALLGAYKTQLDKDILYKKCDFVNLASGIYQQELKSYDALISAYRNKKLNYTQEETISFPKEKTWLNNRELAQKRQQFLKLKVLLSYYSEKEDSIIQDLQLNPEALEKTKLEVIERESCKLNSRLNYHNGHVDDYVANRFLKAIALSYDPHTYYFTQEEAKEFETSLSNETSSFGFEIAKNRDGSIEITRLIPGGPAWNSNQINEGDIILGVKQQTELKSFACLDFKEAMHFLASDNLKEAEFQIKKKNGKEIQLTLAKENIQVESNVIKSFILEGDKDIGYIYLPSFYTEAESITYPPKGCANDVATELIRLKRENIDGLILDLRDNGGGSMLEAVQLAGIFVNYGAITIIDSKSQEAVTLKDMNRGTVYRDPLVILINQLSASASELFAASMQDHNRAIIVGSTSYGKSTAQNVLPIDAYKNTDLKTPAEAYVKVTTGKFYRVTGKSHQKEGVIPDITLPALYDHIELGERFESEALSATGIEKKVYYYPNKPLDKETLLQKSKNRVINNPDFISIEEKGKVLAKQQNDYIIPLSYHAFKTYYLGEITGEEDDDKTSDSTFSVKNPSYIRGIGSNIYSGEEINQKVMDQISTDPYIEEAFFIISDFITITEN